MNQILRIAVLLAIIFPSFVVGSCVSDLDCNLGECHSNTCACFDFSIGTNCETDIRNTPNGVFEYFYTYVAISFALFVPLLLVSIAGLIRHLRAVGVSGGKFLTFIWSIMCVLILFRILYYAIDPHKYIGYIPNWLDTTIYNIPVVLYINVQFLLVVHWSTLVSGSVSDVMQTAVARYRRVAIVVAIISSVTLFPTAIAKAFTRPNKLAAGVYNVIVAIYGFILIGGSSYFGIKLYSMISQVTKRRVPFLKKLIVFLAMIDIGLIADVAITIAFSFEPQPRQPFIYITMHLLMRFIEALIIVAVLLFIWRTESQTSMSPSPTRTGKSVNSTSAGKLSKDIHNPDRSGNTNDLNESSDPPRQKNVVKNSPSTSSNVSEMQSTPPASEILSKTSEEKPNDLNEVELA